MIAKIFFVNYLEKGEEVLEIFHRHIFTLVPGLLRIGLFGFAIPFLLYMLFPQFALFFAAWMLTGFFRVLYLFIGWYYDSLLITNVSLLSVKWGGFFDHATIRLEYQNIDSVSCESRGFWQTVFNYGIVNVAGGSGLHLKDAVNPRKIERRIIQYQEKFMHSKSVQDSKTLKELLANMIKHHAKTGGEPPKHHGSK